MRSEEDDAVRWGLVLLLAMAYGVAIASLVVFGPSEIPTFIYEAF